MRRENSLSAGNSNLEQSLGLEEINRLQIDTIREYAEHTGQTLSILEAGCGQCWPLDLTGVNYTLTGVDLDPAALELRKTKEHDLDLGICGDLCSVELPEASYDVIYSSFVLEHVERADLALDNLVKSLKPGGLFILRLPKVTSAFVFWTRMLPHWAHVMYYRRVIGLPLAGQPGHAPYRTHYHPVIDRRRLLSFLSDRGVECLNWHTSTFIPPRGSYGWKVSMLRGIVRLTSIISFGALTPDCDHIVYIAVKNPRLQAKNSICA
jgi:2-polyprenyl-3-methyl-5-hydroxy-6-metoxy-1,4-benzoquinol methylase